LFKFFSESAQIGFEDKAATACLPLIRTFSTKRKNPPKKYLKKSIQPDVPEMFTTIPLLPYLGKVTELPVNFLFLDPLQRHNTEIWKQIFPKRNCAA
jgi:hypothetical protein